MGLDSDLWRDQGGTHHIAFTNSPTIVSGATPLRDAVRFNGTTQFGTVATPTTTQPFTIYLVLNQITWTTNEYIYDDGVVFNTKVLFQATASPNLGLFVTATIDSNPDLAVGTWGVITGVFNGVNSEIRTNLNVTVTGNAGAINSAGITLGATISNTFNSNIESGYLIIRTGADNTAIQDYIIGKLRDICGLTF